MYTLTHNGISHLVQATVIAVSNTCNMFSHFSTKEVKSAVRCKRETWSLLLLWEIGEQLLVFPVHSEAQINDFVF